MPVRKIQTEIAIGGEKAFNDAMKSSNSNLKTLRTDMAAVSSEFRKSENSIQALTAKQKNLRDQYEQQREIVSALTERLKAVEEASGSESAAADKLRQQINSATVAMNKSKDALDENEKALRKAEIGYDGLKKGLSAAEKGFSAVAKAAAVAAGAGAAAVAGLGALGVAAVNTITDYAKDAGNRAKAAYDQANQLAEQANRAFLSGNEQAGLEYLRQANELIDGIDADYLRFGQTLETLDSSATAAKDALGKILLPALQDLSDEGAALLQSFTADMEAASGDTERQGEIIAEYVRRAVELVRERLPEFAELAVDLLEGLGAGIGENLPELMDDVLGILEYILTTIEEHADEIGTGAAALISRLASFLVENGPQLVASGAALVANIIAGLVKSLPDLIRQLAQLPAQLVSAFQNAGVDWGSIGRNIVDGISAGLSAAWDALVSWFSTAVNGLVSAISNALGIHSPSTVMRDKIGKNLAAGIGVGFSDEMASVSRDMQQTMDESIPGASPAAFNASFSGEGASNHGSSVTSLGGVSVVINGYNVRSDEELAEILSYKLQELLERKGA